MARASAATTPITNDDLALARHLLVTISPEQIAEGDKWYSAAHQLCARWAEQTGYDLEQCAAVLALYSINNTWANNVHLARKALVDGEIKGLPLVVKHVTAILMGQRIEDHFTNGSKVKNFFHSLMLRH